MRVAALCMFAIASLGCSDDATSTIERPKQWQHHELTEAQNDRQGRLLDDLFPRLNGSSNSLDGTQADGYKELLSLADKTGVSGADTFYVFNVTSAGDVHDPSELIIIVSEGRIKWARWPFAEF